MPDVVAERSWETLKDLRRTYDFVVLGGWAAWLLAHREKSHDIDILVDFGELQRLRSVHEVLKNERLRKYEVHADGFDIDIYVPHYSSTLALPAEFIQSQTLIADGFRVPKPAVLLALKLGAWRDRAGSAKGEKDLWDIAGLLPLVDREAFLATVQDSPVDEEAASALSADYDQAVKAVGRLVRWQPRARRGGG